MLRDQDGVHLMLSLDALTFVHAFLAPLICLDICRACCSQWPVMYLLVNANERCRRAATAVYGEVDAIYIHHHLRLIATADCTALAQDAWPAVVPCSANSSPS